MESTSSQHSLEDPKAADLQADLCLVEHSTDTSFSSRRDDTKLHLDRMEKLFSEVQAQQTQVLASGRSRTTSRRSSMRWATDSDTSFACDPQEAAGSIAAVHDYAAMLSPNLNVEDECQAASQGQSLGVIKVQCSLTWTEGSEMNHSQQGVEETCQASTPTQQQPSTIGGSMTSREGRSLQSSPSLLPPARLGAALHRQRLLSSQPEESEELGFVSSNSSHLVPARFQAGNQEGVRRSEWYSYNPMLSVTSLGTSGSDRGSTLGGVDQSCQDFVLMASPVRGAWTMSGTPTKLTQRSLRLSHSPYAQPHPSGLPRSPFQARPMPSLSAVPGNPGSPGLSGHPGSGTDTGAAASATQAGNAEEGSGFAATALGTIRESGCSWESTTHPQPTTSEAVPEADSAMMSTVGHRVTAHMPQSADAGPSQHNSRLPAQEVSLQSPSDSHSELAESVELELDLERPDSSSASSIRSESVPDAENSTDEPALAADSTGLSPEKLLFSHPLHAYSSESDEAQSAAYLTSSEPSPIGQTPSNGQSSLPEIPCRGHSANPLTVIESAKLDSEETPSIPEALWVNAGCPDSKVHLVGSTPQQGGGEQAHQAGGAASVLPTPTDMDATHHLRTLASSEGADGQRADAQPAGTAGRTRSRKGGDVPGGFSNSPAAWADTCLGANPLQSVYDPQRYQAQTSPEEASDHALFSAQALGAQPQLLGNSPRQAAISKLRSLNVKQSQSAKPAVKRHSALTHSSSSAQHAQQAQHASSFGEVSQKDAVSPAHVNEAHQTSVTAEAQHSLRQVSASDNHQHQAVLSHTAQTEPEPAHMHVNAMPFPLSASRKARAVMMSPRRSTSVAKLRTHSLAKHLQEHCHASSWSLESATEPVCAAAALQQQLKDTDAQTEACPQASVPSQARPSIAAAQGTNAHTHRQQEEEELLDTADIDLTLLLEQDSTASRLGPGHYQTELVALTCSAEGLLHSESAARSAGVMTTPGLDRAWTQPGHSKSEGCSPVSMSGEPMHLHSPNLHGSSSHRSASAAGSADFICPAQHPGSDTIVTVFVSSTGAHATVSLKVQSQNSSDSRTSPAPEIFLVAAQETHHMIADLVPVTAVVAPTHAVHDMHHQSVSNHEERGPVSCETAEEDTREVAPATELCLASDAAQQSPHAQLPTAPFGTTDDQAALQQPPESRPTGTQSLQAAPDDPLLAQYGSYGKGHREKSVACSPSRGGSQSEDTVLESPGRPCSPKQSLFGRLEGGLRTLLGRTPKQGSGTSEQASIGAQHGLRMSGANQQSPLHAHQAGAQQHGAANQPLETEQQAALHQHAAAANQPSKIANQQPGTAHQQPNAAHQPAASQQPGGGSSSQQPATQQPGSADANQFTTSEMAHEVPNAAGKHVPRAKQYALARLKNINSMRQLKSLSTTGLQQLRARNGTHLQKLSQKVSQTVSPRSHAPTPPKPPSASPIHAYTNPAFCPAFVSRIPKPAPLNPTRKPGDPKQTSAHFKRNPRSPRLALEQSQHNSQDPKQPAGNPQPATRDSLHPFEELPSTSQMQPAVHAMPAGFESSFKSHRLGAIQHAGQERSDWPQRAAAAYLADDQQRPTSSSHLFHQPGHTFVSVVSEDAAQSSHQQEHIVGALPAGDRAEDSIHALHAGPYAFKHLRAVQEEGNGDDWDESSFGDMCRRLVAVTEGARIRHRMRHPACKGLCSEILEMDQMVLALGEAHTHTPADAGLQRQLQQQLRVRRIQLGELLASALPVPDSLPITKPLLPSHTSLSPPPSGPAGLPANAPLPPQNHKSRAAEKALDHGGPSATAPASVLAHDAAAVGSEGPSETALQDIEPSCCHRLGEEAVRAPGGALKGVAPAAYSTLQAAQKQLQEVKQHLSASLTLSPRTSGVTHTPHRMAATRAASNSPVAELTTPSPFSGSRDDQGGQLAPQGGATEEGSSEKKPFLRRRPRHMPVSQRLNWSEVKPRTQCRLEPSYIPVRKSNHQRVSADQAASQEAAGASPTGTCRRLNPRKAWGSNQPDPRARAASNPKQGSSQSASDYQSPYAATPGGFFVTQARTGRTSDGNASKDQGQSATAAASQTPGPLDDILGQVTDLLSQVNDILGR
ncbi:TPA: hypothetical protein ACH3X1_014446 [Trebouxia sp. C0004]